MNPSMLLFISLCLLLCVLLSFVVILPWLRGKKVDSNQLMAVNVAVFGERIAELNADKQAGVIDEASFIAQETELKRQLLSAQTQVETYAPASKKSRLIVMVWIPILAILVYLLVGDRTPVYKLWTAQDSVGQVAEDLLTAKIDAPPQWATKDSTALISAMQTNVYRHAHDPNRWMRLSELFLALQANPQALEALARAYRLEPTNTQVALTYAQTSFFANNGTLDATARDVLLGVLKHEPDHEGAQMLMAMGEARAGNFTVAKAWIAKLRANIAGKSGDRSGALASLDELVANIDAQEAKVRMGVHIAISVAPKILPQIQETDALFVSVSDGRGGAPYAVKRLSVMDIKDGQVNVTLSDLDAMMPERTLSNARSSQVPLSVTARISRDGTATAQSGDFFANPVLLQEQQNSVNLSISQIVP